MTGSSSGKGAVVVMGATGYVGGHLVSVLGQQGYDVRCLVRRSADAADLDFLRSCGARIYTGDLTNLDPAAGQAFDGAATAVHLIGSIAPRRGESLEDLHLRQTESMLGECVLHHVPRVLLLSSLGTSGEAKTIYHATKWQSEQCLRGSQLKHIIVRPSLIVGKQVGRRDSKLVKRYCDLIASQRPQVPLIAGGENKIQPIFIGDLVAAMAALLATDAFDGRVVELGGPEVVTMRQFVETLMSTMGIEKQIKPVPPFLARLIAFGCQLLQDVPLITADQVTLSTFDNLCRENRLERLIGNKGTPLFQALRAYAKV